jgi:pimeloyl-ACP methyl ester carboxylesterase
MDDHTLITSADGTRIAVRRVGTGDPVVALHGSGGGLHSWAAVAERLAGRHELWLVARRGHDPSDQPDAPNSFAVEVADVRAVLAAVRGSSAHPAHLIGASTGAILALHTALDDPGAARSLALFEPPLFATGPALEPVLERYRALLARDWLAELAVMYATEVARVPHAVLDVLAAGGASSGS